MQCAFECLNIEGHITGVTGIILVSQCVQIGFIEGPVGHFKFAMQSGAELSFFFCFEVNSRITRGSLNTFQHSHLLLELQDAYIYT